MLAAGVEPRVSEMGLTVPVVVVVVAQAAAAQVEQTWVAAGAGWPLAKRVVLAALESSL
jgi:hypothetical protein